MNKLPIVKFHGQVCTLEVDTYYNNGRIALALRCADGEPMADCTTNLGGAGGIALESPNNVHIKNYSENVGMASALTEAGVAKAVRSFCVGFDAECVEMEIIHPAVLEEVEQVKARQTDYHEAAAARRAAW